MAELTSEFASRPVGTLLSDHVLETLERAVATLADSGAHIVEGGRRAERTGFGFQNTVLRIPGKDFLRAPERLQTEAFGNATLAVMVDGIEQACEVATRLEGSLTGSLYAAGDCSDDELYGRIAPILRQRVGRLLNDKMPTGVAVSPAMNHGGPFPATGHPGFTAVGIPASMRRFAMLQCYDNVRPQWLPVCLQDPAPNPAMWRYIDGVWTQGTVAKA
jgi:NADP-dependent aldehyde dehydrogenase